MLNFVFYPDVRLNSETTKNIFKLIDIFWNVLDMDNSMKIAKRLIRVYKFTNK